MSIKKTLLVVSFLVSFTFVSCTDSKIESPKLTEITICQWGQALIYLPLYIAQEKGFFGDEGLKVKIINGGGDDLTWAAVTSGNAQFGIADPTMVAIQDEQGGVPGKVIGSIVSRVSFWAITFDKKVRQIKSPVDFRGNTVACFKFPNTAHALALKTFKNGNLEVGKDVNIVPVNYEAVLAQLKNKEANIAMVLEPAASIAIEQGARIVYSYPEDWGSFSFTGLTTTQKYIDENPDVVQRVVNALERAMRFARVDFDGTVSVGKKAFPDLSENVIKMATKRMLEEKTLPESILVDENGWLKALQLCVDVEKLKKLPEKNFIDNRFALKAIDKYENIKKK
ncbi:MAG: ABC transporter substrate-binding protein [Ignavibacteriaceae bacterium]|nr:ABC transporter substrate-binding protein [Ignavibacteriaceae bacterium]